MLKVQQHSPLLRIAFLIFVITSLMDLTGFVNKPHPRTYFTFEQICHEAGYVLEKHWVTTEDGYINSMFRIRKNNSSEPLPTAMLVHGFTESGNTFVVNVRDKSPVFVLAEQGYDVWVINFRGNFFSMKHQTLSAETDVEYWEGSTLSNTAIYDIPAFIKHAKDISKFEKLTIVAHSMGT